MLVLRSALRGGARGVSGRMRQREHQVMEDERLEMIAVRGDVLKNEKKGTEEFLKKAAKLEDVSTSNLLQCTDIKDQLDDPAKFVTMLIKRSEGSQLTDKWCSSFIMCLYQALKRHRTPIDPTKIAVQSIKALEKHPAFEVGTSTYNTLLSIMYQEKMDVKSLFSIYATYKTKGNKANHLTYALLFSASARGHKGKNAENFFQACERIISTPDFSFAGKNEVITQICFGIADSHHAGFALRLVNLLRSLCVAEGRTPMSNPERPKDRKSEHLYLSSALAERVFWASCRCRSLELLPILQQWVDFLTSRDYATPRLQAMLMRSYAINGDLPGAFRTWDMLAQDNLTKALSDYNARTAIKSACIVVIENAARTRQHEYITMSRAMIRTMEDKAVITSDEDKMDLYLMQIKLLVHANKYNEAREMYNAIKHKVTDSKVIIAIFSGRNAKDNLPMLKEIYADFKHHQGKDFKDDDPAVDRYIALLADNGELEEVLAIMNNLVDEGGKMSLDLVHRVLQACARDKNATSYGTFYKYSDGSQEDMPLFFSHLKNSRTTKKNCDVAQRVFDRLSDMKLHPTTKTYNNLMAVYAAAGEHEDVSRIYNTLKNDPDLSPDQYSFYFVARAWAGKGAVDMVETVFNELLESSQAQIDQEKAKSETEKKRSTYNTNKLGFNADLCAQALRALSNTGMKIETVAYTKNFTAGEEELDWMEDLPTKVITTKQPRPIEVDMGFKLVNVLKELSLHPTARVYSALLGLCTRAGDFDRAEDVYKMIKEDGGSILSNSDVVTSLMKMHYTRQNMEDAMNLLDDVTRADSETKMDLTGFHNCISTCAVQGHVANARHVLAVMFDDQAAKVTDTAIALALVACAHSDPELDEPSKLEQAKDILREQRELHKLHRNKVPAVNTQHVFHKLLYVCAKETTPSLQDALDVLQEMRELNIVVDPVTMLGFARCLSSVADFPKFWNVMDRARVEPDTGIIFRLLKVTERYHDWSAALDIMTKYPGLCNEKLHLMFYNLVQNAKLSPTDHTECDAKFAEAFGKTLKDLQKIHNRRVKEHVQEASEKEKIIKEQEESLTQLLKETPENSQSGLF